MATAQIQPLISTSISHITAYKSSTKDRHKLFESFLEEESYRLTKINL